VPTDESFAPDAQAMLDELAKVTAQIQRALPDAWRGPATDAPIAGGMADSFWRAWSAFGRL